MKRARTVTDDRRNTQDGSDGAHRHTPGEMADAAAQPQASGGVVGSMQQFEESPTSEHWIIPSHTSALSYEHMLAAAGETNADGMAALEAGSEAQTDPEYYSRLLFVLTHKHFPAARARTTWLHILQHRDGLARRLGRNPGIAVAALDYLSNIERGFRRPTLIDDIKLSRLVTSATRDSLTGLYHRSVLDSALTHALAQELEPVSVLMIDLDHFKRVNDARGHLVGDRVLEQVGSIIQQAVRESDLAVRFGGEEFCVVVPGLSAAEAVLVAERLRVRFEHELTSFGVTASIGVASASQRLREPKALLRAADEALYLSKHQGRNRVSVHR